MNAAQLSQTQPHKPTRVLPSSQVWGLHMVAFVLLVALELLCFAPIFKHVGFYLDDWITLNLLYFGPKSFPQACWQYLISDPRVVARPVEAFYYVVLYFLFGLKPLGWHVLNAALEVGAAFFLYLAIARLTGRRALALLAGLILIIYPNHDVTHYWATCSSENLSLCLVMASLYTTVVAAVSGKPSFHGLSALLFAISLFCYETFLPLILLNVVFAYRAAGGAADWRLAGKQVLLVVAPFLFAVALLLFYSRLIAPHLGVAQVHPVSFDALHMLATVAEGVRINFPVYALGFFGNLAAEAFQYESARTLVTELLIASLALGSGICFLARGQGNDYDQPVFLLPLGAVTFVASYSIFGLNPEYMPTFRTILSRINEGSAVAIALMVSGTVALILHRLKNSDKTKTVVIVCLLFLLPVVSLSFLANRGYARAWELCWYTQTSIRDSLESKKERFKDGDAIILANCPRYVMWSPLFDGVWDFQPMAQIALNKKAIKGGVVSERMVIDGNTLKDISKGTLCNTYEFGRSYLIFPPHGDVVPINSPSEFISLIGERGMKFGLDKSALSRWQTEADKF